MSAGAGIPWHEHTNAWLEILQGQKRWWTARQGQADLAYDVTLAQQDWVGAFLGDDPLSSNLPHGVCGFTQSVGEVVFTRGILHATYNLAPFTLAVGRQDTEGEPGSPVITSSDHRVHMSPTHRPIQRPTHRPTHRPQARTPL